MGIVNRDLDKSEQLIIKERTLSTVTGSSFMIGTVQTRCRIQGAFEAALGLSGTPAHVLVVERFNSTGGATIMSGFFATLTPRAIGTSGVQGYSATTLGSTLFLRPGDVISLYPSGTNAAVREATISVVLQALDDIKVYPV